MIAPIFDRCVLCGRPAWKVGERLCIFHDIRYCIEIGAARMRERMTSRKTKQRLHDELHS